MSLESENKVLEEAFEQYKTELAKFKTGNKAAGTRARNCLMRIKNAAHAQRKNIQNSKTGGKARSKKRRSKKRS